MRETFSHIYLAHITRITKPTHLWLYQKHQLVLSRSSSIIKKNKTKASCTILRLLALWLAQYTYVQSYKLRLCSFYKKNPHIFTEKSLSLLLVEKVWSSFPYRRVSHSCAQTVAPVRILCVCVWVWGFVFLVYACMGIFSHLQFSKAVIKSVYSRFSPQGIFNRGPASLSPLSEKARYSIHDPRMLSL